MSVFEKARGSSLWIELPHALLSELAAAVSGSAAIRALAEPSRDGLGWPTGLLTDELIQLRGVELLECRSVAVGRETRLPSGHTVPVVT